MEGRSGADGRTGVLSAASEGVCCCGGGSGRDLSHLVLFHRTSWAVWLCKASFPFSPPAWTGLPRVTFQTAHLGILPADAVFIASDSLSFSPDLLLFLCFLLHARMRSHPQRVPLLPLPPLPLPPCLWSLCLLVPASPSQSCPLCSILAATAPVHGFIQTPCLWARWYSSTPRTQLSCVCKHKSDHLALWHCPGGRTWCCIFWVLSYHLLDPGPASLFSHPLAPASCPCPHSPVTSFPRSSSGPSSETPPPSAMVTTSEKAS